MAADAQGYVSYYAAESLKIDDSLFTADDLFNIDVGAYGGATLDMSGGCNISFDGLLDIDFNLDEFTFDFTPSEFDRSLFDKADQLSMEFTMINTMLINSIVDMECCDIAKVYNITLIPFFKFFADSEGGTNFITMLVKFTKVITQFRALVEPLECLIRLVPGNPWFPKDFDYLAWIYGYFKESKPFLDRLLSGELVDILINPVHNMRVKMQACLNGGIPEGKTFQEFLEIGNAAQIAAISKTAILDGKTIVEAITPSKPEPKKPLPKDFEAGEGDQRYIDQLAVYNIEHPLWLKNEKYEAEVQAEISRQKIQQQAMNSSLALTLQTHKVIKINTSGLCGCVADALGINDFGIDLFPIRMSGDLSALNGKAVKGVTNKQAGVTSPSRPAKGQYVREEADSSKATATKAVVDSGEPKGKATESTIEEKEAKKENPYITIDETANAEILAAVKHVATNTIALQGMEIVKSNDRAQKLLTEITIEATTLSIKIEKNLISYDKRWLIKKNELLARLQAIAASSTGEQARSSRSRASILRSEIETIEMVVANDIFNSHFATLRPFDFTNDQDDSLTISNYLSEDGFWGLFPPEYWETTSRLATHNDADRARLPSSIRNIPFPPNIPPETIIKELSLSTKVDIDERFKVVYFDAGFVREKGSASWRNFNKLNLAHNTENSIGIDKTTVQYTSIFPSDVIGDKACFDYTRNYPVNTNLQVYLKAELENNTEDDIETTLLLLESKYQLSRWEPMSTMSNLDIVRIIDEVAIINGYNEGKFWVKTRRTDPETKVETEYIYTRDNDIFKITINGKAPTTSQLNRVFANTRNATNAAVIAKDTVNASIKERGQYYVDAIKASMQRQSIGAGIDTIRHNIMNVLASSVPTETVLDIPCTCGDIMCAILNTIIQYVMAAFKKVIDEIIKMVVRFLIPDWVKDLARLVKDIMKCLGSIFGIVTTVAEIEKYSDELLESMKGRVSLYPADACFLKNKDENAPRPPGTTCSGAGDDTDDGPDEQLGGSDIFCPAGLTEAQEYIDGINYRPACTVCSGTTCCGGCVTSGCCGFSCGAFYPISC